MTRTSRPSKKIATGLNVVTGILSAVTLVSLIAVAVLVTPTSADVFRFPKDLWVRGETIVILACWILLAIYRIRPVITTRDRPVFALAGVTLGWIWITAALSTNRVLSARAAAWSSAVTLVLLTMYLVARRRGKISDLWFLLLPGCLNALLAISQSSKFWNPFLFIEGTPLPQRITGMVGNPNELGSYLALPFIVSLALMIALPERRWLYGVISLIILSGLFASRTRTAMIAVAAGVVCLIWIGVKRRGVALAAIAAMVIAIAGVMALGGFVTSQDLERMRTADGLDRALSGRLTPLIAAMKMFKDHPVIGVGPGAYSYWYFDYKIATEHDHPSLFHTGQGFSNFGEAHNDHAQILAEMGVPGLLLFLTILIFVASDSFRDYPGSDLTRVARFLAFPVAATLLVLCLGQFPLRVASATISYGFVLVTALGWVRR